MALQPKVETYQEKGGSVSYFFLFFIFIFFIFQERTKTRTMYNNYIVSYVVFTP